MAFSSTSTTLAASPNVTPLIDVLLVLLIIFMVITPVSPQGLISQVPSTAFPAVEDQSQPLTMRVEPPLQEGLPVRYVLQARTFAQPELASVLQAARAASKDRVLWVEGEPSVDYRAVVAVVDAAHAAGFARIGLIPRERH